MTLEQISMQEIKNSELWHSRGKRMYLQTRFQKRIELINWVPENMKNHDVDICRLIESRMNETI